METRFDAFSKVVVPTHIYTDCRVGSSLLLLPASHDGNDQRVRFAHGNLDEFRL